MKFAKKAIDAGVDALVCEGFEAGGHNGKRKTTSLCLIPLMKKHVQIPLIAAGGIYSGSSMLAAMILGADGVFKFGVDLLCLKKVLLILILKTKSHLFS